MKSSQKPKLDTLYTVPLCTVSYRGVRYMYAIQGDCGECKVVRGGFLFKIFCHGYHFTFYWGQQSCNWGYFQISKTAVLSREGATVDYYSVTSAPPGEKSGWREWPAFNIIKSTVHHQPESKHCLHCHCYSSWPATDLGSTVRTLCEHWPPA